ncbi:MAG: hypothetical protein ACLFTK_13260 [Anaerolineales bacterium]
MSLADPKRPQTTTGEYDSVRSTSTDNERLNAVEHGAERPTWQDVRHEPEDRLPDEQDSNR